MSKAWPTGSLVATADYGVEDTEVVVKQITEPGSWMQYINALVSALQGLDYQITPKMIADYLLNGYPDADSYTITDSLKTSEEV